MPDHHVLVIDRSHIDTLDNETSGAFRWTAYYGNFPPVIGYGPTELDAISDLARKLAEAHGRRASA